MEIFIQEVLQNLTYTGIGTVLFIVCYLSNMSFGIWYNVKVLNQKFEWGRIKESALKLVGFSIGTILMCVGITVIPIFCDVVGLTIPEQYTEVFQKFAIVSVFIYSAARYLMEAYGKFRAILEDGNGLNSTTKVNHYG